MANENRYSRLNPAYLATRHAGMVFMLLALGLLAGVAWRSCVQPTAYSARVSATARITPFEQARSFDWDDKQQEWRNLLRDPREWGMLHSNLRHAVKLVVAPGADADPGQLSARLALFDPDETISASLFAHSLAAYFGTTINVSRQKIAENMDIQSLAAVVADLDPSGDVTRGWDFTFFSPAAGGAIESRIISRPGPGDPYFRVLYTLHSLLNDGREAVSPAVAWRSAVDEVSERLEREAQFAGGGGFGPSAARELVREIAAMPTLAANSLYFGNGWFRMDADTGGREWTDRWARIWSEQTGITVQRNDAASGTVNIQSGMLLRPLAFPRDTAPTRLPPLAVSVLLAYLSSHEATPVHTTVPMATVIVSETTPPAVVAVQPVRYRTVIDEAANKERLDCIATLEESVRLAIRERDACLRKLNAAREDENRLAFEAVGAHARADRLRERYDDATVGAGAEEPAISEETARSIAARDALLRRLAELLTYCTEEHPFVKQARRELASVEAALANQITAPERVQRRAAAKSRLAGLRLEWESADTAAATLEQRRRRQAESVAALLDELTVRECVIGERESELADMRRIPVPMIQVEIPSETAEVATTLEQTVARSEIAVSRPVTPHPRLSFSGMPSRILLDRTPPGWGALWRGLFAGLAMGAAWVMLRELLSRTFQNGDEARRMVKLPVLAALPAYNAASFRAAADTVKGELKGSKSKAMEFIPAPVELFEPATEARRGRVVPAAVRRRPVAWFLGLCLLILACALHVRSRAGFAQPGISFDGEMPVPGMGMPAVPNRETGQRRASP